VKIVSKNRKQRYRFLRVIMPNNFEKNNDSYYGIGSFLAEIVKVFFLALLIIAPIRIFLFQPFFVQGASMEPNFEDGEYLIVNELGYKITDIEFDDIKFFSVKSFKDLKRGDVIVFRYPKNPKQYFIKRVIALPGEKIEIRNDQVIISQKGSDPIVLDESEYLAENEKTSGELTMVLKDDEYFVMGDNRSFSSDSRSWGPVKKENIIGKVLIRAWPFDRVRLYLE